VNLSTSSPMKRKFPASALWVIPLLSLLLTGCASASREASASLAASTLYSPPVLRIYKDQQIQTRDGIYRPQVDEVWHSDARYRLLEQENINLAAALQAARKP